MRLRDSTLVITGATSGIGLATARGAARKGARLFLTARSEGDLRTLCEELRATGAQAAWATADVADPEQVRAVAERAVETFGRLHGWIHCAATGLYAPVLATTPEEEERLFEVNFWGTVHSTLAALERLRRRGGSVVIVSTVLAERALPWQGVYAATQHALKAWLDALRMELVHDRVPVGITLLRPGGVETPFVQHARAPFGVRPALPPPLYHPDVAARAVLRCVRRPRRDAVLGDSGLVLMEKVAPGLADRLLQRVVGWQLRHARPEQAPRDGLFAPLPEGAVRGWPGRPVLRHSLRSAIALHPLLSTLLAAPAIAAGVALLLRRRSLAGT